MLTDVPVGMATAAFFETVQPKTGNQLNVQKEGLVMVGIDNAKPYSQSNTILKRSDFAVKKSTTYRLNQVTKVNIPSNKSY